MIPLAFWEGLGVGLLASVVGTAALWWYLHQRERGGGQRLAGAHAPAPRASPPLATTSFSVPVAASVAAVGPGAPESPPRPIAPPTFQTGSSVAVATDGSDMPAPANGGQVRISQRVLYHIARQGRIGAEEVAPRALTQAGMVEVLQVNQGALTGVLRRLVAAGVLDERREHVRGADRRLKVYRLTPSGEQLFRDLRSRQPPGRPSAPPTL